MNRRKKTVAICEVQAPQFMVIEGGIDISEPLKPILYKHKCQYDCSFLDHHLLSKDMAENIAYAIILRMNKLKKPIRQNIHPQFAQVRKFIIWILDYLDQSEKSFAMSVKASLAVGEMPDQASWQFVINLFREKATTSKNNPFRKGNKRSRNSFLHDINKFLEQCRARGVFPIAILKGIRNGHLDSGRRKILGDLPSGNPDKYAVERRISSFFVGKETKQDIIENERKACFKALVSSGIDLTGLTDIEIIEQIRRFNTGRLLELRRCAEADFIKGWKIYQEGQNLLEECDLSYDDDMRVVLKDWFDFWSKDLRGTKRVTRNHPVKEMFLGRLQPKRRENTRKGKSYNRTYWVYQNLPEREALARVLTLLDGRYGLCPKLRRSPSMAVIVEKPILSIWRQVFTAYGRNDFEGWPKERLGASNYTLLMAQILILIDTGLNVEVVNDLTVDCVRSTDVPTVKEIWGVKSRAKSKAVLGRVHINDPNHKINSIQVIEMVKEMTRRIRHIAKNGHPLYKVNLDAPRVEEKLFVREKMINVPYGEVNVTFGIGTVLNDNLQMFKRNHPTVGEYNFTLGSIRPTVRVLAFINGETIDISCSQMNHANIGTTTGYVMRTMSRMAMEERIREFMKHYEAIIISDIPGAAVKLGYTAREYEERLKGTQRTGLGTICDHLRKDGNGNEYSLKQRDCDPVSECPECPLARVFPALKENLVDAFIMRRWIKENEVELRENEERWQKVWMRWLAIVEGVIDKAKTAQNVKRTIIREAEKMAEEIFEAGGIVSLV